MCPCPAALAAALAPGGVLYLSTPAAVGPPPRPLQYRVHVYEWSRDEAEQVIGDAGLVIEDVMGLLPPAPDVLAAAIRTGAWLRPTSAGQPARSAQRGGGYPRWPSRPRWWNSSRPSRS